MRGLESWNENVGLSEIWNGMTACNTKKIVIVITTYFATNCYKLQECKTTPQCKLLYNHGSTCQCGHCICTPLYYLIHEIEFCMLALSTPTLVNI